MDPTHVDPDLVRELRFLGIVEQSWPALALLPLIQVAWADGEIQEAERELILRAATEHYAIDDEGHRLLETWLTHPPSEQYLARGREAFHLLASHFPEMANLNGVLEHAEAVAKAAGGVFGFRAVDAREREVLSELTAALSVPPAARWDWTDMLEEDEDLGDEDTDVIEMGEADPFVEDLVPTITVTFQATEAPRAADGAALVRTDVEPVAHLALPEAGASIGRSRACDLWIRSDAKVSRHHALLYCEEGAWRLQDNTSTTGTWVNGERILDRRLFGGEEIHIGDVSFRFELQGA